MTTTAQLYAAHPDPERFTTAYFSHLSECLATIDPGAVASVIKELAAARAAGERVFIAGNGGSAATSSHMVNDLATDVARKARLTVPFRVSALTDNNALMTALANDIGYENVFVAQLQAWFQPGDRLLAISASGNSPNLLVAARWVREHGGRVISFVGFDGGELQGLSDVCVHVRTAKGEYGVVEDAHLALNHLISNWLICSLSAENQGDAAGR
ncbi:MAG TPA: SIS domain-containing protein [Gemmatimonadaceae bacterium]|nr:SIS domain-containing protein [Gemmatimonadaceae bacterium]